MLQITVPSGELWDEKKNEFIYTKEQTLSMEHSLVSLSKWEARWRKPFLSKTPKTSEETIDYVRCMTLTQNVDPMIYYNLSRDNILQINDYISAPMTATWFGNEEKNSFEKRPITAEVIYYWMITFNIPVEFQKWHLNRLFTLIRVCKEKNRPPKKMNQRDIYNRNASLNAMRKKQLHSKG